MCVMFWLIVCYVSLYVLQEINILTGCCEYEFILKLLAWLKVNNDNDHNCCPLSLFITLHLQSMPLWSEWCAVPCFSLPASLHPSSLSSCLGMLFTSCSVPHAQGGGGGGVCVCVCARACFGVPEAESCCHWELLMVSHWLWAPLLAAL